MQNSHSLLLSSSPFLTEFLSSFRSLGGGGNVKSRPTIALFMGQRLKMKSCSGFKLLNLLSWDISRRELREGERRDDEKIEEGDH